MSAPDPGTAGGRARFTRRQLLITGAAASVGGAAALAAQRALSTTASTHGSEDATPPPLNGGVTVPFFGPHQAGIDTDAQAHAHLVALDLRPDATAEGVRSLLRLLSDDAARLTQGRAALADTEPELAVAPARLTITLGFGPGLVARSPKTVPPWLRPLPPYGIDALEAARCDGDLLLQLACDDAVTLAHALRMLLKDARAFSTVRWSQAGFRRAHGTERPGTTMRNLFGQVDGTSNPLPGTPEFDRVVWASEGWLAGGTGMVVRRIRMDLDGWDRVDREGRDAALGRFQSNGAPLTSSSTEAAAEFDEPDLERRGPYGFPVIPSFSHVARARTQDASTRIFRRSYNYDDPALGETGLLFLAFQADVDAQYVPIQRRLAELDLLNQWTTPTGSAVFAIPPGCDEGGYVGETLFG